jgi:hypothetical protein
MPLVGDELGGLLLHPIDLATNKALAEADAFARERPPEESGCLPHVSTPGGVLPRMY